MQQAIVPMIHVPDVRATAAWYTSIGFTLERLNDEDGEMNWALLTWNGSQIMLNISGKPSNAARREVDLYIHTSNIEALRKQTEERLGGRMVLIQDLYDTFYGMREFIIRDCNGFWITFGQPLASLG